jgi:CheY-like chemotaxis protein
MPIMDGFTAARHIRDHEITGRKRAVPIIAMTAFSTAEDQANCLQAGMTDYLPKPFSQEQLIAAVVRNINR